MYKSQIDVIFVGQMNPANPNLYRVLQDLYSDIINLWPESDVFHMGGDEVISIISRSITVITIMFLGIHTLLE